MSGERPSSIEPAITRLQLELGLRRRAAEACLKAGYRSAAEIAACDDAEFHARVALDPEGRADVLARARAPGTARLTPGERPVLTSERNPAPKVLALAKPVTSRLARLAGDPAPVPPKRAAPKADPPQGEAEARRKRRKEADEIEAELDDRLRGG
jgi:hypothetical protein